MHTKVWLKGSGDMTKTQQSETNKVDAPVRCVLVGDGTLLIQCADALLDRGFVIAGVATDEEAIVRWCANAAVTRVDRKTDLTAFLKASDCDYLFSVVNLRMLPEEALAVPKKMAINFHDGPLPEFAGVNTPMWALLNGAKTYGVTWHEIEAEADTGKILSQVRFEIADDETQFSLNAKCFTAGNESFLSLADALVAHENGTKALAGVEQDLSERQYFDFYDRPPSASAIDFDQSADVVARFIRAHDTAAYPNPVAWPKFVVGARLFSPQSVTVCAGEDSKSEQAPAGTIVHVEGTSVRVTTASDDVRLDNIRTMSGETLSAIEVEGNQIVVGQSLAIDDDMAKDWDQAAQHAARFERRIRSRLQSPQLSLSLERSTDGGKQPGMLEIAPSDSTKECFSDVATPHGYMAGALATFLARAAGANGHVIGVVAEEPQKRSTALIATDLSPWRLNIALDAPVGDTIARAAKTYLAVAQTPGHLRDLLARTPRLSTVGHVEGTPVYPIAIGARGPAFPTREVAFSISDEGVVTAAYDAAAIDEKRLMAVVKQFEAFLASAAEDPSTTTKEVSLLSEEDREVVLRKWNDTAVEVDGPQTLHALFREQAEKSPEAVAVAGGRHELTYAELDAESNKVAAHLQSIGVEPGALVGVSMARTPHMMVALFGILKAGAAYVPLDPAYPKDRITLMIDDAKIRFIVTDEVSATRTPSRGAKLVCIDGDDAAIIARQPSTPRPDPASGEDLAYVIYTSGSTGKPKGVMVEHRNVANFFAGMDARLDHAATGAGTWLAVTSLNFDISVLELFWTLARGFKVVLFHDEDRVGPKVALENADLPIDFGAFYFSSDEGERAKEKYRLLIEGAKFADTHGFSSVWTPERHFHAFGGLFPNPSVTSAAIATITENVSLRAGSCVSPLHSSIRIAEEWSVVDNLSGGRVGISFAAGWQPNDFVIKPETFKDRKAEMFRQIEEVKELWRGGAVTLQNGTGDDIEVKILPRPVQEELPVWVTAAGNPDTFAGAGKAGANILTHLLGQTLEELRAKIAIYRQARKDAGHEGDGIVSLMLHTFVADDDDTAKEVAREPMKAYLKSAVGLIKEAAWSFPTFKDSTTTDDGGFSTDGLTADEFDALLDHAYERYFETSGLFGSTSRALQFVDAVKGTGADEIACLIDFGVPSETVLAMLPQLAEVLRLSNRRASERSDDDASIASLVAKHNVTHLQCTPSMAAMMVADEATKQALTGLKKMMVGGEAFGVQLATELEAQVSGDVINMYGPTETTIWSTTHAVNDVANTVPIGTPIANTSVYVLDDALQPVPPGALGELVVGGAGVVRGYLGRPELTAERFVPDPFSDTSDRMYRTGDLVSFRSDGVLEFQGRLDHQVKIRGYRMELGEIETQLEKHPMVRGAVVLAREDTPDNKRLVAYVIKADDDDVQEAELKTHLRSALPDFMVPSAFVFMQAFPTTPNQKIDRKAFPAPEAQVAQNRVEHVAPENDLQQQIAEIWQKALGVSEVGLDDNFFDLGGHSLLTIRVLGMLKEVLTTPLNLVDLFRYPTIRTLCAHIEAADDGPDEALEKSAARGDARKEALARRQKMAARRRRR